MFLNEDKIRHLLEAADKPSSADVERVLAIGASKKGLSLEDTAILLNADTTEYSKKIFETASRIKQEIYGERVVLFAPLYVSDHCVNDCAYCNFHSSNKGHARHRLTPEGIATETECLIRMGHKRVLVEFGEDPLLNNIDYICEAIKTIYSVNVNGNNIRRVNVNIAATSVENYRRLKAEHIGTYQLFQETYHKPTFEIIHKGPKADYERQITAHERAFEAGLDDLGIGVLFGLHDWRFEVMALIAHAQNMERKLGVGPHTISVPRFRPSGGVLYNPPCKVDDASFLRLIAILRIAVPYTGMILSTRESPELRRRAFQLGISQASAASICAPGGYSRSRKMSTFPPLAKGGEGGFNGQFSIADTRSVDEVIKSLISDGLIPSFCTACYRVGRTGDKFMELARPGEIHNFCRPNALLTFAEYLEDFGDGESKRIGSKLICKYLSDIQDDSIRSETSKRLSEITKGKRDLFF